MAKRKFSLSFAPEAIQHMNLIEALQFRVNGLVGLQRAFHATAATKNTGQAAATAEVPERCIPTTKTPTAPPA